jgi:hypothetical protein
MFSVAGFADDSPTKANEKVSDFDKSYPATDKKVSINAGENHSVYFFAGFDFKNYKISDPAIAEMMESELSAIRNGVPGRVTKAPGAYTIIGHSQGGLRVLAYASYLKAYDDLEFYKRMLSLPTEVPLSVVPQVAMVLANDGLRKEFDKQYGEYPKLNAVITISGINKGLKALEGDFPAVRARVLTRTDVLWRGFLAAINGHPLLNINGPKSSAGAVDFFAKNFLPEGIKGYIRPILDSSYGGITANALGMYQIGDMVPGNGLIKNNIVESVQRTVAVQTGIKTELTLKWEGDVPHVRFNTGRTYTYYAASQDVPKFDVNLPVGYIVGLNNSPLSLAGNYESTIRTTSDVLKVAFIGVETWHIALSVGIIGLFNHSVRYAQDASKAWHLCKNLESELRDMLLCKEGDGLAAKESQYIPSTYRLSDGTVVRQKVLGDSPDGVTTISESHLNIVEKQKTFTYISSMIEQAKLMSR